MKTSLQYEITKLFELKDGQIDFSKNYAFPIDENFKRILKYINDLIDTENTRAGRSPMVYNWLENFDTTYSAEFMFYMLTGTEAINSAKLKIVGQNYRGYSGSITSGGSGQTGTPSNNTSGGQSVNHTHDCPTTNSAGSHQHSSAGSHGHTLSGTAQYTSGSSTPSVAGTSASTVVGDHGSHTHGSGSYAVVSHTHTYYRRTTADSGGSHTHPSTGSHTHSVGITGNANQGHTHSLSSHTHGVGDHTHGLSLNITEGNDPTGVNVYVNDGAGFGSSIATDNSPVDIEIDIKSHLTTSIGWKKLRVTSTREGRISVTLILDVNLLAL